MIGKVPRLFPQNTDHKYRIIWFKIIITFTASYFNSSWIGSYVVGLICDRPYFNTASKLITLIQFGGRHNIDF